MKTISKFFFFILKVCLHWPLEVWSIVNPIDIDGEMLYFSVNSLKIHREVCAVLRQSHSAPDLLLLSQLLYCHLLFSSVLLYSITVERNSIWPSRPSFWNALLFSPDIEICGHIFPLLALPPLCVPPGAPSVAPLVCLPVPGLVSPLTDLSLSVATWASLWSTRPRPWLCVQLLLVVAVTPELVIPVWGAGAAISKVSKLWEYSLHRMYLVRLFQRCISTQSFWTLRRRFNKSKKKCPDTECTTRTTDTI